MPLITLPVFDVRAETPRHRIVRLDLEGRPFPYRAGQHALLGDHGQPQRLPYSIASAPIDAGRQGRLEFLIQVVENESPGPHLRRLERGVLVDVDGPAGDFVLPAGGVAAAYLFVGGGTGIAPLRSMIGQVLETQPDAAVSVVHSARTPDELSYRGELRALAAAGRVRLLETVTRAAAGSVWAGARGRLDAERLAEVFSPGAFCFVCGPDSLVEDVPRLLASLGATHVRTEHWKG